MIEGTEERAVVTAYNFDVRIRQKRYVTIQKKVIRRKRMLERGTESRRQNTGDRIQGTEYRGQEISAQLNLGT
jgi:hypothetical protein